VIELAASEGVPDLVLHALTDGRDTLPRAGAGYLEEAQRWLRRAGRIGTVGGRYWGMDRDKHWDRTKRAYDAIIHARGERADDPVAAVKAAYERDVTDEFIEPTVIGDYDGTAADEPVIYFNFRPDRARQLTMALGDPDFSEFHREGGPVLEVTTMTRYRAGWPYPVAFSPMEPETTLAEVIAENQGRQLHVAETEKYAHVTYFFNGGREQELSGEERHLVPSPRDVPTYDKKPEMSAAAVAREFGEHWRAEDFRFGVINFANADMVGHTGVIPAAVAAAEEVDRGLAGVVAAVHEKGGACIITADHGNAEQMLEPDGTSPNTAHSTNPVPAVITVSGLKLRDGGILADVAPTVLDLLDVPQPEAMTGRSLIEGPGGQD
jgi:2,3-bisphosphoglycerate-independent phosphoglycerate mutase